MATMESLIGLVNRIQRACTVLGDYGGDSALPTLWEALPSVVVVGGQVLSLCACIWFCMCVCVSVCDGWFWNMFGCVSVEFGKVVGVGEHCWPWFSSQRIRLGFCVILYAFVLFFWIFVTFLFPIKFSKSLLLFMRSFIMLSFFFPFGGFCLRVIL